MLQILLLVRNTYKITKVTVAYNEKKPATELFERRKDLYIFFEELYYGKEKYYSLIM